VNVTSTSKPLSARRPICGPEIAAELSETELAAAMPSLLPPGWLCGVDDVTPNTAHVYARPRERCASLEVDVGDGDFSVRDLEAGAKDLSRHHRARVVLWDEWDAIYFIELQAGEPIARLGRSHAGGYRGTDWHALAAGKAAAPFPADLLPLLGAGRDAELVEGLRRWQHGARGARGARVAQIFRRYITREASPALRAVARAAFRRARWTGSAQLKGFGRLLWRAGDGHGQGRGRVAVRPARSLLRFFDGGGATAIDFSALETRLGAGAVAQAELDLTEALTTARDSGSDVVFPGLLCITTRYTPAFASRNPRDGSTFVIPGHLLPFFIFDDAEPAAARAASSVQSTRA
jgi:hypothetical protein